MKYGEGESDGMRVAGVGFRSSTWKLWSCVSGDRMGSLGCSESKRCGTEKESPGSVVAAGSMADVGASWCIRDEINWDGTWDLRLYA